MDEERKPWDRQRHPETDELVEPALWFNRFDRYFRPQGPERTLEEAWRQWKRGESKGLRGRRPSYHWSCKSKMWDWWGRAEAWDEEERQKRLKEEEHERAKMLKRQVKLGQGLQGVGGSLLTSLSKQLTAYTRELSELAGKDDAKEVFNVILDRILELLPPGEARRFILDGSRLEREARGMPGWLLSLSTMSDDELVDRHAELIASALEGDSGS